MNVERVKSWLAIALALGCSSRNLDLDESELETEVASTAPGRWDCYSQPEPERPSPQEPPARVSHVLDVVGFGNPSASPDELYVRACQIADSQCNAPVLIEDARRLGLDSSAWQIDLPFGFDGYLEIQAPDYVPMVYYFGGPLIGRPPNGTNTTEEAWLTSGGEIAMLRFFEYQELLATWNVQPDAGRGLLMLHALDCNYDRTAGVGVALNVENDTGSDTASDTGSDTTSGVVPWISVGGVPVTHENPVITDADGFGGFANVPPVTIVAESVVSCTPLDDGTTPPPHFRMSSSGAGTGIAASQPCSSGATETVHSRSAFRVRPGFVTMTELRSHHSYRD